MTLPPLVERELRVASRLRSTSLLRVGAALVASVLGGALILVTLAGVPLFLGTSLGRGLFTVLTWMAMAVALLSGPFLTSDSLSMEKREGTLGFLFLTDLRGHDVVLGKLMASALRAGYALLAILPVLALTLILGGITGAQFWKTALSLGNALVLSLSAGLFCSCLCREGQKALGLTLLVLVLLTAAGPVLDASLTPATGRIPGPFWSLSSPGYLFVGAGAWGRSSFWGSWMVNQLIIGVMLAFTCIRLPRSWQETGRSTSRPGRFRGWPWKPGGTVREASQRRRLLDRNPIVWVVGRERWIPRLLWVAALVSAVVLSGFWLEGELVPGSFPGVFSAIWTVLSFAIPLLAYLAVAFQSCRFFGDARRSGLLELLLSTPLTAAAIVRGHWFGLLRRFGPPLALLLVVESTGALLASQRAQRQVYSIVAAAPIAGTNGAGGVTNAVSPAPSVGPAGATNSPPTGSPLPWLAAVPTFWMQVLGTLLQGVSFAANLAALVWVGMWLGVTTRSVNIATLKTLLFVHVIPLLAISLIGGLSVPLILVPLMIGRSGAPSASAMQTLAEWMPVIFGAVYGILTLAKDAGCFLWAYGRLSAEFRDRAALEIAPALSQAPAVMVPVPAANAPRGPSSAL